MRFAAPALLALVAPAVPPLVADAAPVFEGDGGGLAFYGSPQPRTCGDVLAAHVQMHLDMVHSGITSVAINFDFDGGLCESGSVTRVEILEDFEQAIEHLVPSIPALPAVGDDAAVKEWLCRVADTVYMCLSKYLEETYTDMLSLKDWGPKILALDDALNYLAAFDDDNPLARHGGALAVALNGGQQLDAAYQRFLDPAHLTKLDDDAWRVPDLLRVLDACRARAEAFCYPFLEDAGAAGIISPLTVQEYLETRNDQEPAAVVRHPFGGPKVEAEEEELGYAADYFIDDVTRAAALQRATQKITKTGDPYAR